MYVRTSEGESKMAKNCVKNSHKVHQKVEVHNFNDFYKLIRQARNEFPQREVLIVMNGYYDEFKDILEYVEDINVAVSDFKNFKNAKFEQQTIAIIQNFRNEKPEITFSRCLTNDITQFFIKNGFVLIPYEFTNSIYKCKKYRRNINVSKPKN